MKESDRELLCACAAGDCDAFGRFVRRNTALVLRFCLLRVGDEHGAEDAAQEAMLRLYQQVRRDEVPQEPLPWLLAIARRCCQESQRQRIRNGARPLQEADTVVTSPPLGREAADLGDAIVALNDFETAVLQLKHTNGLRCRQISEQLGKPMGTVTAALSRAYAKLRARLDKETSE